MGGRGRRGDWGAGDRCEGLSLMGIMEWLLGSLYQRVGGGGDGDNSVSTTRPLAYTLASYKRRGEGESAVEAGDTDTAAASLGGSHASPTCS